MAYPGAAAQQQVLRFAAHDANQDMIRWSA